MGKIIDRPQGRYLNGSRLLAVAQTGSTLVGAVSASPKSLPAINELISAVEETNALLSILESVLDQYSKIVFCDAEFIEPLCDDILEGYEQLRVIIDTFNEKIKMCDAVGVLDDFHGMKKVGELKKRLEDRKAKVEVLIAGVKVMALRKLRRKRTQEEEAELVGLMKRLPDIIERMTVLQKEYAERLEAAENAKKEAVTGNNNDLGIPDPSGDADSMEKSKTKVSLETSSTSGSSVTVVDDSIEEAWLLRRNEPKKVLKGSHYVLGLRVSSSYTHEEASYYVKPLQSSASDIKEIRESACRRSTEAQHQIDLKKMVLSLDDKAQWEIQKLLETRDKASSTRKVKKEWEVVAFQTRPRRKISATVKKKWWKKGKQPLVEWVMVIRGETIDHQRREMPVKNEDPWKKRDDKKAETGVRTNTPDKGGEQNA